MRSSLRLFGLGLLVLVLAGCAAGNGAYSAENQAGFFSGVWHGWIAPFALIGHVFDGDIRIFEPNNDGIWYDVGFYCAVISGFGSLSVSRTSKRERGAAKKVRKTARVRADDS